MQRSETSTVNIKAQELNNCYAVLKISSKTSSRENMTVPLYNYFFSFSFSQFCTLNKKHVLRIKNAITICGDEKTDSP